MTAIPKRVRQVSAGCNVGTCCHLAVIGCYGWHIQSELARLHAGYNKPVFVMSSTVVSDLRDGIRCCHDATHVALHARHSSMAEQLMNRSRIYCIRNGWNKPYCLKQLCARYSTYAAILYSGEAVSRCRKGRYAVVRLVGRQHIGHQSQTLRRQASLLFL